MHAAAHLLYGPSLQVQAAQDVNDAFNMPCTFWETVQAS